MIPTNVTVNLAEWIIYHTHVWYLFLFNRIPGLRTLSIKENPFCKDFDWQGFVIALLPKLVYLECHFIHSERREISAAAHQGDIFRAQNQEEALKEAQEQEIRYSKIIVRSMVFSLIKETLFYTSYTIFSLFINFFTNFISHLKSPLYFCTKKINFFHFSCLLFNKLDFLECLRFLYFSRNLAEDKKLKAAFVSSVRGPELVKSLMECNAEEEKLLKECLESFQKDKGGMDVIWIQFRDEMTAIGNEIYELGLRELKVREQEVKIFEECVRKAQKHSQEKGVKEVFMHAMIKIKNIFFDKCFNFRLICS